MFRKLPIRIVNAVVFIFLLCFSLTSCDWIAKRQKEVNDSQRETRMNSYIESGIEFELRLSDCSTVFIDRKLKQMIYDFVKKNENIAYSNPPKILKSEYFNINKERYLIVLLKRVDRTHSTKGFKSLYFDRIQIQNSNGYKTHMESDFRIWLKGLNPKKDIDLINPMNCM